MKVKIDLHIHSVLSACCSKENTVNNIVNMSKLLDNQIIAIADHNTALNARAASKVAQKNGILVVPAMEVTTAEEIHVLCLFKSFDEAEKFSDEIYESLPKYRLDEKYYNPQIILDENDCEIGRKEYLLSVATKYDLYELITQIKSRGGIPIPAHIDRESNSIMSVLGFVPNDLDIAALEISQSCPKDVYDELKKDYILITGSDAHSLEQMCETECFLDLDEISLDALFEKLGKKP
ncbi:MAG TPA: PHP domain-containing protein [Clostridia bacterium]|nr:PHP domain-containing protein [Clostridia bacterium]